MLTVAHVSDLHIGGRPESVARAAQVIAHVCSMSPAPDVLLVTGDIADHGSPEEYATARDLLSAWDGPLLVGTGNHDVRGPFARVLMGGDREGPLDQELDVGAYRFLMLDSLVPAVDGQRIDHGELAESTLAWLDERLDASPRPTFVCFHHPPTTVGIGRADEIQLRNGPALEAVLTRHRARRRGAGRPQPHDVRDDVRRSAGARRAAASSRASPSTRSRRTTSGWTRRRRWPCT